MKIPFTKLQSAGNDFVIIEESNLIDNYADLAVIVCDRHFGIGADGLLVLSGQNTNKPGMTVFNADGSEAEACGNGLRCLVKYIIENNPAPAGKHLTINTRAGPRTASIIEQGANGTRIETSMGWPEFEAEKIPVNLGEKKYTRQLDINFLTGYPLEVEGCLLNLSFVSMGNPHAVHFINNPVESFPLECVGPVVENHALFPERVNFEIVRIINRQEIEARVWERGVGETLACGSGACAIGVISRLLGFADKPVTINLLGGQLTVKWESSGEVFLQGIAKTVFTGELQDY